MRQEYVCFAEKQDAHQGQITQAGAQGKEYIASFMAPAKCRQPGRASLLNKVHFPGTEGIEAYHKSCQHGREDCPLAYADDSPEKDEAQKRRRGDHATVSDDLDRSEAVMRAVGNGQDKPFPWHDSDIADHLDKDAQGQGADANQEEKKAPCILQRQDAVRAKQPEVNGSTEDKHGQKLQEVFVAEVRAKDKFLCNDKKVLIMAV